MNVKKEMKNGLKKQGASNVKLLKKVMNERRKQ